MKDRVWPASIVASLIFIFVLLFILLQLSRTVYPVNMDMQYMSDYQTVDKNYDAIVASQSNFDSTYHLKIITNSHSQNPVEVADVRGNIHQYEHAFTIGKNRFTVEILDNDGRVAPDLTVSTLISRMDTDRFDQKLDGKFKSSKYELGPFSIESEGRYKILVRATKDGKTGYFSKTVYAK